jgi:hypothetical protein
MRPWLLRACVIVFVASLLALSATNLVVWRRTVGRRRGRSPPPRHSSIGSVWAVTSRVTWLPGTAGLGTAGAGLLALERSWVVGGALAAWGTFIAASGFGGRVAGLEIADTGLTVRFGHRPSFTLAWADCTELLPPRTPFGGWKFVGRGSFATLMPSDLIGLEWVLDEAVRNSRLQFGERTWRGSARQGGPISATRRA